MNQKIFNNLILLIIIFFIIKAISPEPDSLLFILQKYVNYFYYQIKKLLGLLVNNEDFQNQKIQQSENLNKLNSILQSLIKSDIYDVYLNSSDPTPLNFTSNELDIIKNEILSRLNSNKFNFKFNNLVFENIPNYYSNMYGKELDAFIINIDSNVFPVRLYIECDIRNDIYQDVEYLAINQVKLLY
jgi:hypothetical protein